MAAATVDAGGHGSATPFACDPMEGGQWRIRYITAQHIPPPYRIGGRKVKAVYRMDGRDVAVAVVYSDVPVAVVPLGELPQFGDRLWAVGFPLDPETRRITEGYACDEPGAMSVPIAPGNSGGAVLNDRGQIVGVAVTIAVTGLGGVWHISAYEPIDSAVLDWLLTKQGGTPVPQTRIG